MKNISVCLLAFVVLCGCDKKEQTVSDNNNLFNDVAANFDAAMVYVADSLPYDVLFVEKEDMVLAADGRTSPAKRNHDYTNYIPINGSDEGLLYISHECNDSNSVLGDGGGGTVFTIKQENGKWTRKGDFYNIDFSTVGTTFNNCSGAITTTGTILTAEEFPPSNNTLLYRKGKGTRDTSDYNNMKRFEHTGWMVEVDVTTKKALRKLYHLGRFSHEGAWAMEDGKTVYMSDDYNPSVFFKFVAEKAGDLSKGQLYAYSQSADGKSGSWIELPMDITSLINCRDIAISKGATMFTRMEWITLVNGKLYLTETGADTFSLEKEIQMGGKPSYQLMNNYKVDSVTFDYPYGCVMEFDPATNAMRVVLAGGASADGSKHFANPDGITHCFKNNKPYLVINEDVIEIDRGRVSGKALEEKTALNEIYWLDLTIANPKVEDLKRFLVAPKGCETTGGYFTPDFKTYFVNIQHPDTTNVPPFNRSCTIAVKLKN